MDAPEVELQRAIYAALKASSELLEIIHDVYDDTNISDEQRALGAPFGSVGGYITFGPEVIVPDIYDDIDLDEITIQIDIWSSVVGRIHCKGICRLVRDVLKDQPLDLPTHGHVTTDLTLQRILPDPDSSITHGVMQFTAHVEKGG